MHIKEALIILKLMAERKRILFLLHLPPPVHGSSVVGGFIKTSKLINDTFYCFYINLLASSNISDTGQVTAKKILGFLSTIFKLVYQLVSKRPQLCYLALTTTGAAFFKDAILILILKVFRIRRVYHLHNKGVELHRHILFYSLFYKFVFKNSEVILLSKYLYNDISAFVKWNRVYICPNGTPSLNADFDDNTDQKKKAFNILFLSNLFESKGVVTLLKACTILKSKRGDFKCTFIGGEGDISKNDLSLLIRQMALVDHVVYEGKKYAYEKHVALSTADVFVFPTYYHNECFPLVLLEAMSYSLPIVTTSEGGIADIVIDGKTGFLVSPKNPHEISSKLELLMEDKSRFVAMGLAGKKKYLEEYTLDTFEQRMLSILKELIKKADD